MAVTAMLQAEAVARTPELRQAALQTELDRLDALQVAWWDRAVRGDFRAVLVVLKIMAQRARLQGLDKPAEPSRDQTPNIIISGTEEEYIAGLQAVCAADEAERSGVRLASNRLASASPQSSISAAKGTRS